ncbi:uncharacterized protein TRAVEDRAFT_29381 [Trametes versicolor FP-101664 SS1]|uniref:uncharacterized protein n=1 Tax=Trametes versicolor (strain FP-101664) TaxID=717944 RepID=UPI00046216A1|nr:uncharacterized protein TRAVEDRAFT_29381 [Trametes versicolor FP-101664 SS1]EIW57194.1 hypothetical protein TRAVEDRAFT_29381 [Trametes versicolor FP-101664 SS1]
MTRLFIPIATVPDTSGPLVSRTWLRNPTPSGVLAGLCIGVISHGRDKTSSAHVILARYRPSQPASIHTGARAREVVSSDTPSPYNLLQLPKDVVSLLY